MKLAPLPSLTFLALVSVASSNLAQATPPCPAVNMDASKHFAKYPMTDQGAAPLCGNAAYAQMYDYYRASRRGARIDASNRTSMWQLAIEANRNRAGRSRNYNNKAEYNFLDGFHIPEIDAGFRAGGSTTCRADVVQDAINAFAVSRGGESSDDSRL